MKVSQKVIGMNDGKSLQRNRGLLARIFGVVLVITGFMDCMLAWRGGFQINLLFVMFIMSGILVFAVGAVQKNHTPTNAPVDLSNRQEGTK